MTEAVQERTSTAPDRKTALLLAFFWFLVAWFFFYADGEFFNEPQRYYAGVVAMMLAVIAVVRARYGVDRLPRAVLTLRRVLHVIAAFWVVTPPLAALVLGTSAAG